MVVVVGSVAFWCVRWAFPLTLVARYLREFYDILHLHGETYTRKDAIPSRENFFGWLPKRKVV